ncbi:MAG TPA: hypothetical protein VND98_04390 [Solirubrobacterales bacterium]|nr:hypothetical protein [Solirubrobacterales bacterium]
MNKNSVVEHAHLDPRQIDRANSWELVREVRERYAKHARTRRTVRLAATAAAAAILLQGAWVSVGVAPTWSQMRPQCSLRYSGTAASVDLQGWGSGGECQRLRASDRGFAEGSAGGPAVCRLKIDGLGATVRDRSSIPLAGAAICAWLRREATPLSEMAVKGEGTGV